MSFIGDPWKSIDSMSNYKLKPVTTGDRSRTKFTVNEGREQGRVRVRLALWGALAMVESDRDVGESL